MTVGYINGRFASGEQLRISPMDLGLLRGTAAFEYFRTYARIPFQLQKHLLRLERTAQKLAIPLHKTAEEITEIISEIINQCPWEETTIRIVATPGETEDGITPIGEPSFFCLCNPLILLPNELYENGARAITTSEKRTLGPIKSTYYAPALCALKQARKVDAHEAFYLNDAGDILEGTTSNFFYFRGDTLFTADSLQILPGITRSTVLSIAKEHFAIEYQPLSIDAIDTIDEAFTTSSVKEILPIIAIDDQIIGRGCVEPNTRKIMELFRQMTRKRSTPLQVSSTS